MSNRKFLSVALNIVIFSKVRKTAAGKRGEKLIKSLLPQPATLCDLVLRLCVQRLPTIECKFLNKYFILQ